MRQRAGPERSERNAARRADRRPFRPRPRRAGGRLVRRARDCAAQITRSTRHADTGTRSIGGALRRPRRTRSAMLSNGLPGEPASSSELLARSAAPQYAICFGSALDFGILAHVQQRGRPTVDLTLRLDVLAAFAAFAFVGAILLGAF